MEKRLVDDLSPEDEAMLARCMGRFKTRLALARIGIPGRPHPVSDDEYRAALEGGQADGDAASAGTTP